MIFYKLILLKVIKKISIFSNNPQVCLRLKQSLRLKYCLNFKAII